MIEQALEEALLQCRVTRAEFSELLVRLLDYGVICRDESQVEALLYDRYQRCEQLLREWLAPLGLRLQHDARFQFIRVYPPGAEVPGMADQEEPHHGGFRARLSQQEVAAILVLRIEYDKALREGQVDDSGCVALSLEALELGLRNVLKMSLPERLAERKLLLKKLRQLRLVQFAGDDTESAAEILLRVRPTIAQFVTEETLQQLLDGATPAEPATSAGETEISLDVTGEDRQAPGSESQKAEAYAPRLTPVSEEHSLFASDDAEDHGSEVSEENAESAENIEERASVS